MWHNYSRWLVMCRVIRVRLKRDDMVYSRNIIVENATHVISFDSSRAYRGYVEGRPGLLDCISIAYTSSASGRIRLIQ